MVSQIKFSEETMQSEKGTGFNNYSLCYFAKARRGLPEDADVNDVMDFYLSCCSIQVYHCRSGQQNFEMMLLLQDESDQLYDIELPVKVL